MLFYNDYHVNVMIGAIQLLRNAVGGGRVSDFTEKPLHSTLLALRGGGC